MWGKRAEAVSQFLLKGGMVYVEGEIQTRKWQGKDGQDRYTTEILVQDVQLLGGRSAETTAADGHGEMEPEPGMFG